MPRFTVIFSALKTIALARDFVSRFVALFHVRYPKDIDRSAHTRT